MRDRRVRNTPSLLHGARVPCEQSSIFPGLRMIFEKRVNIQMEGRKVDCCRGGKSEQMVSVQFKGGFKGRFQGEVSRGVWATAPVCIVLLDEGQFT